MPKRRPTQAAPPEVFEAIEALGRLTELFARRRAQLAKSAGLTDGQWQVLEEIATEHFMPSLFAKKREASPAGVSRTLRQLQDKGLVSASAASGDARAREYRLTRRGRALLDRLRERRAAAIETVWRDLNRTSLRDFAAFSTAVADRLEAYALGDRPREL